MAAAMLCLPFKPPPVTPTQRRTTLMEEEPGYD